jgi:hypothetical protein
VPEDEVEGATDLEEAGEQVGFVHAALESDPIEHQEVPHIRQNRW